MPDDLQDCPDSGARTVTAADHTLNKSRSATTDGYAVGQEIEVTVDKVAHGGHFVARHGDLVVFVRHALPGERVSARVTEINPHYLRADAIEIHSTHPARVMPECAAFRPGGCGGCDFAHADNEFQRELKLQVLREALTRQGKLPPEQVDALTSAGITDLGIPTGWRMRMRYRTLRRDNGVVLAMHAHRSEELVDVTSCVIANSAGHAQALEMSRSSPEGGEVLMAVDTNGPVVDFIPAGSHGRTRNHVVHTIEVDNRKLDFRTRIDGFWQVHPALAQSLVETVLAWTDPQPGQRWWDLYAGVGPIAAALASRIDPGGHVVAVESETVAVREARRTLERVFPGDTVSVVQADVRKWIAARERNEPDPFGVVLDPPRSGAGRSVLQAVAGRCPTQLIIVACDPVALGRDTAILADCGYRLEKVRAWDAFPQTHHLETVALFSPDDQIS